MEVLVRLADEKSDGRAWTFVPGRVARGRSRRGGLAHVSCQEAGVRRIEPGGEPCCAAIKTRVPTQRVSDAREDDFDR